MKVLWSMSAPSDATLEALDRVLAALRADQCREILTEGLAFERRLRREWSTNNRQAPYSPHVGVFDLPLTTPAPYTGDGADPGREMSPEARELAAFLEEQLEKLASERAAARWPDPVAAEVQAALAALVVAVGQAFRSGTLAASAPSMTLN